VREVHFDLTRPAGIAYSTSSTSAGSVPNAFWAGFVGLDILQAERELVGIEAFGAAAEHVRVAGVGDVHDVKWISSSAPLVNNVVSVSCILWIHGDSILLRSRP
jgi:hypothetical protein